MPKKSRQTILSEYQKKVDKCIQWRDSENYDKTWRRLNDLYRGKHWPSTTLNNQDLIAVNLAFSTINVIAPSVAVNYPKVVVQANNPENRERLSNIWSWLDKSWLEICRARTNRYRYRT